MTNLEGFVAYYQPQYEHSTGKMVGAEALARKIDEDGNVIPPVAFIGTMEKDGSITDLDFFIFEEACKFIKECMDDGINPVTISINIARHDILSENFVENLEKIRNKYRVPVDYLWLEITESVVMVDIDYVNRVIEELHQCGYVISMDDFGSGYSSLNILKDMELDAIKLDMNFFRGDVSSKAGIILNSIMHMIKWLKMAVIAEGVDNIDQADFMKSIGCDYIQGYIYSRPLPCEEFRNLLRDNERVRMSSRINMLNEMDSEKFWDPTSLDTIIFNSIIGGCALFTINKDKKVELLRINENYLNELQMNITIPELMEDPMSVFDEENAEIFYKAVEEAIRTGEEQDFKTWRSFTSDCCGTDRLRIRSKIRVIGTSANSALIYSTIMNITEEKHIFESAKAELEAYERGFKNITEQANIYYWEYEFETKEMRPCFRCMRDLGLPSVVYNYPEPVIESGLFPADYADLYRDMLRALEEGADRLEEVIPLTKDRIPFIVRYTTENDNHNKPIKAYGSATLVVK
ncbi:MAG: EAL domain-containing protein [Bacillota bacterium]|nr:EAL domain-containing protein [Bacillota bacterium]